MIDDGGKRGSVSGEGNGDDHVVESVHRGEARLDGAALGRGENVIRIHARLAQQGAHERDLVFTVAVMIREDVAGVMRLISAEADLDGDVANVVLRERADRGDLVERRGLPRDQLMRFRGERGCGRDPIGRQRSVPGGDVVPGAVRFSGDLLARRNEVHAHPRGDGLGGGTMRFVLQRDDVAHLPDRRSARLRRRNTGAVEPFLIVRPAAGEDERVAREQHRYIALKGP